MNNPIGGTAGPGQVITLARRSAWIGLIDLAIGRRRVVAAADFGVDRVILG